MTNTRIASLVLFLAGCAGLTTSASARDWDISFFFGGPRPRPIYVAEPAYVPITTTRTWIPDHYETRTEQVLCSPAHYENVYVPPAYETRVDPYGRTYSILVNGGYWTKTYVAARYETRTTQVLVPGYYADDNSNCAPTVASGYNYQNSNYVYGNQYQYSNQDYGTQYGNSYYNRYGGEYSERNAIRKSANIRASATVARK